MPKRPYTVTNKVIEANRKKARSGGLALLRTYGRDHFSQIGKLGYKAMRRKYDLIPWGTSDWAIVSRKTGQPVALLSGEPLPDKETP